VFGPFVYIVESDVSLVDRPWLSSKTLLHAPLSLKVPSSYYLHSGYGTFVQLVIST
jgi:hypothetical protein